MVINVVRSHTSTCLCNASHHPEVPSGGQPPHTDLMLPRGRKQAGEQSQLPLHPWTCTNVHIPQSCRLPSTLLGSVNRHRHARLSSGTSHHQIIAVLRAVPLQDQNWAWLATDDKTMPMQHSLFRQQRSSSCPAEESDNPAVTNRVRLTGRYTSPNRQRHSNHGMFHSHRVTRLRIRPSPNAFLLRNFIPQDLP